jgi:hypothetical protein
VTCSAPAIATSTPDAPGRGGAGSERASPESRPSFVDAGGSPVCIRRREDMAGVYPAASSSQLCRSTTARAHRIGTGLPSREDGPHPNRPTRHSAGPLLNGRSKCATLAVSGPERSYCPVAMRVGEACPDCPNGVLKQRTRYGIAVASPGGKAPRGAEVLRCEPASTNVVSCGAEWLEYPERAWTRLSR